MTVQDPHMASGVTEMYRSGGYNPSTHTSSPTYTRAKTEETLPDWVVNNNKVTFAPPACFPLSAGYSLCTTQSLADCDVVSDINLSILCCLFHEFFLVAQSC